MSNFKTWTQEDLAQFAQVANDKMVEQNERIEQLQRDVKDAIEAYRAVMRKAESQRGQLLRLACEACPQYLHASKHQTHG